MIVADSSYLVEELLSGGSALERDAVIVPDLAIHEVANAIFVQEHILHKIQDGSIYLGLMFEAIESGLIRTIESSEELIGAAYEVAGRNGAAFYDCLFVAVALSTGQILKTRDEKQKRIYDKELARKPKSSSPTTAGVFGEE